MNKRYPLAGMWADHQGTWLRIELDDGQYGWVAAFISSVHLEDAPVSSPTTKLDANTFLTTQPLAHGIPVQQVKHFLESSDSNSLETTAPLLFEHLTRLVEHSPTASMLIVPFAVKNIGGNSEDITWQLSTVDLKPTVVDEQGVYTLGLNPNEVINFIQLPWNNTVYPIIEGVPVVKGLYPLWHATNERYEYWYQDNLLAVYTPQTKTFFDVRSGIPLPPSYFLGHGELTGSHLGYEGDLQDYFVYGYEIFDLGDLGYQLLQSHLVDQVQIFREQTIPVILANAGAYQDLADRFNGTDPYQINTQDWSREALQDEFNRWQFPAPITSIVPPPASIETTVGRLESMIENGKWSTLSNGSSVWVSENEEISVLNVDRLIEFLDQYDVEVSSDAIIDHLFGHITNDDELNDAQRFMLLSGIESASPQPVAINVYGDKMFTHADLAYIELDRTGIWASLYYNVPEQMRGFLLHELGGHGDELWGDTPICYHDIADRRSRIEPLPYMIEMNDLLIMGQNPNPTPLYSDYTTLASTIKIFFDLSQPRYPENCVLK
ncbi:MAG: hypothetical protein ACOYLB_16350 [Phototrophicaceae bacterium]